MDAAVTPPRPSSPGGDTFAHKLAHRPRARFFITFLILGFVVTPVAVVVLLVTPSAPARDDGSQPVPVERVIAAILIALHCLCAGLAWYFWRDDGRRARPAAPQIDSLPGKQASSRRTADQQHDA